jgi:hypothetical protein
MKQFLLGVCVTALVAAGVIAYVTKPAPVQPVQQPVVQEPNLGSAARPDHYEYQQFFAGLAASKFFGIGSVSGTSSTTSTVSLTAGASGQITLGTSTPGTTVINASTTAITLNSMVYVQQSATTTLAGVTCNTTPVASIAKSLFASSTSLALNGFSVTVAAIPTTNPLCLNYLVVDKSR